MLSFTSCNFFQIHSTKTAIVITINSSLSTKLAFAQANHTNQIHLAPNETPQDIMSKPTTANTHYKTSQLTHISQQPNKPTIFLTSSQTKEDNGNLKRCGLSNCKRYLEEIDMHIIRGH
jgi:hypothetical protein